MKIPRGEVGLSPKNFVDKEATMQVQRVEANKKKSKAGKDYTDYTIIGVGSTGDLAGDVRISYLFPRDMHDLMDAWGDEPEKWTNKLMSVKAFEEGEYFRWKLKPVKS